MLGLFRQLLLCVSPAAALYVFAITQVFGQAALLPNAKQTFLDGTGKPLAGGKVYFYVPGSTNKKTTWSDNTQTSNNTNPVTLDAAGRAVIFGQGAYRQVVQNSVGVQQWDAYTNAYGSSAPSGATGTDTAPVGSIMVFTGFTIPTNWRTAYGQALARTDYPELLTALTISHNSVSCSSGSPTLAGWPDTSQMRIGAPVEATCIPTGTTIVSITNSTTIVVSNNAVSTSSVTATVFPWGNGDGVSTFNVPDLRGRMVAGSDCMGGVSCASRLLSATTISTTNGSTIGTLASASGVARGMVVATANVPTGTTVANVAGATAITNTISTTNGSPTITVSSGPNIVPGMVISSANVPANTTVAFINSNTVTMSANATATASGTAATFNIGIELSAPATATASATPVTFYSFTSSGAPAATGGSSVRSLSKFENAINSILSVVTDPGHRHTETVKANSGGSLMAAADPAGGTNVNSTISTDFATTGVSVSTVNDAAGANHLSLPPMITSNYIIKVKSNTTGAGGVTSLGGLFGDIAVDATLQAYVSGGINYLGCTTATSVQIGCSKPDGVTITVSGGTLTAIAGVASSIDAAGSTSITNGTPTYVLYDNAGKVGVKPVTGTGSAVLDTAPTITAPVISGHATIEGVTPTGATGGGNLVFSLNPTITSANLVTPTLGAATATSINKISFTAPATSATLTIADGKTLTDTSAVAGAILLGASGGGFSAYSGYSCTNQFARSISAAGVISCATVTNSDLANSSITFGATSVALGGTLSAATGRASSGLNVESLHTTGDADVTIASTTRTEGTSATLTAVRTWTLPAASSLNAGQTITVSDIAGAINGTNVLTIQRAGSDLINGATSFQMSTAYRQVVLVSNGSNSWTFDPGGSGGAGVTSFNSRTGAVTPVFTDYVSYVANFLGAM